MNTGFSLMEILHRENPVLITGMGLQCRTINDYGRILKFQFPTVKSALLSLTLLYYRYVGSSVNKMIFQNCIMNFINVLLKFELDL